MDMQRLEQLLWRIEKGSGIMVSRDEYGMAARRIDELMQKAVIKLLSTVAGSARVKDVSRHQKHVDLLIYYRLEEPVQKILEFLIAFLAIKNATKMPVGRMQDLHSCPLSASWAVRWLGKTACSMVYPRRIIEKEGFLIPSLQIK
jgi:hypothetical protein